MSDVLLGSPLSPFARKARVVIAELGITDIPFEQVATSPVKGEDRINAANPLGKIPALVRDEGPTLYDSRVITRYLDATRGGTLYPAARLWEVLTLEATADGMMEAAVGMIYEERYRPEEIRFAPWVEGQWGKVSRALDAIEGQWMSHLAGPLDMGQIAVGCALGYLDLRHAARDWRAGRPALAAWEAGFATRPAMSATAPA
ncbi:glutathione S-transferase [Roseicyclus mahoneyensis]|uniref:Glutathione S-transferase n=1 Tax=Roseicyclus mahoneyensis TaxID=164332 RepID=A0A316GFT1_9RHOB|nr:glutathione S-transferase [Roseicyclus mahoneyensis]PWK59847.1 glutathione S-transferase [Roseicyclus mahoneyensis]